jgi:hypothetical protein
MMMTERTSLPKNDSFTSVTDVLQIHQSEGDGKVVPQQQMLELHTGSTDTESSSSSSSLAKADAEESVVATEVETTFSSSSSKMVRFGVIDQRIYNRIVGDHPEVKVGPPITFSWEYGVLPSTPIDEYEAQKLRTTTTSSNTTSTVSNRYQRSYDGLRKLSSITRKNMLRTLFEVSEEEIIAAEREVQQIQKQRERSISQSTASAVVESSFRRAGRKVRKSVGKVFMAMATLPLPSYAIPSY